MIDWFIIVAVPVQSVFVPEEIDMSFEEIQEAIAFKESLYTELDDALLVPPPFTIGTIAPNPSVELAQPEMVERIAEQVFKTSSDISFQLAYYRGCGGIPFYTNFFDYSNYNQYER